MPTEEKKQQQPDEVYSLRRLNGNDRIHGDGDVAACVCAEQ